MALWRRRFVKENKGNFPRIQTRIQRLSSDFIAEHLGNFQKIQRKFIPTAFASYTGIEKVTQADFSFFKETSGRADERLNL